MKNKKKLIASAINSILIITLTTLLIVNLSYAWYVVNKVATMTGGQAITDTPDTIGDVSSVITTIDTDEESDKEKAEGLLIGDEVTYKIKVSLLNHDLSRLDIKFRQMDGGYSFCKKISTSAIELNVDNYTEGTISYANAISTLHFLASDLEYFGYKTGDTIDTITDKEDSNRVYIKSNIDDDDFYYSVCYDSVNDKTYNMIDCFKIDLVDAKVYEDNTKANLVNTILPDATGTPRLEQQNQYTKVAKSTGGMDVFSYFFEDEFDYNYLEFRIKITFTTSEIPSGVVDLSAYFKRSLDIQSILVSAF